MNEHLVSIIITTYNYGQYLAASIESALNQTYKNIEIIVVDDGSEDNSKEIAMRYPVKYIFQKHQGVSSAKNEGFSKSHGDYIVFLDADDKLAPNFVEMTLMTALQSPKIGFVYTGSKVWYEGLGIENIWLPNKIYTKYNLFAGWHGPLGCVLIRRKAFESLNSGFDPNLPAYEDLDLCFRLLAKGWKCAPVFAPLHWYRLHDNHSLDKKKKLIKAQCYLNKKYWGRVPFRYLHYFYTSTLGRLNSFLQSPLQYLRGMKNKIMIKLWLNNHQFNSEEGQKIAQTLLREISFTTDMLIKWHRDIHLRRYYQQRIMILQSKLIALINCRKT